MKGKIVSFVASKKFGFIDGEDGESYFLHVSKLKDKKQESQLIKGTPVSFDPVPTPKGLSATQVEVLPVHIGERLVSFFVAKGEPKHGKVIFKKKIETSFEDDKDKAFDHFKACAQEAGCNAVINFKPDRQTFEDGNYKYSSFSHIGELALVIEEYVCTSAEEAKKSKEEVQQAVQEAEKKANEVVQQEAELRTNQLSGCLGQLVVFVGIASIFYVII
ncbi:Cold shock protein, CspA family [Marinospirillum celere]|uniref:Cold shock protein, CspA family n=1 Tax=Marinospirillum celere TaxID=1122252 RepID=A0A1I1E182_9GAMM|nr:cold shock domain-containing protein [Marinospirillum celere]SFB80824.1 Cold shock protein, CspA family [Marinospirillum celere]